jgi:ribosomal-protein-alanine N-acetyltransferase
MLETERLIMRPFEPEDLPQLIELRDDDEVIKYIGGRRLQNPEEIEKRLRFYIDCHARYGYGMSAVIWKESGVMIGWAGLQPLEETGETEVGYGFVREFWGRGLGFECARAWLEFGFTEKKLERIVAVAVPENAGSWRIMEKLGMTREKVDEFYGLECVFYGISQGEYFEMGSASPNFRSEALTRRPDAQFLR